MIMPADTIPRRKIKKKYTVLFIPPDKSKKQRNFVFGKIGLSFTIIGVVSFISIIIISLIIYTPLGNLIPVNNPELENRYGKQIVAVQEKINNLLEEISSLKQYNLQLRKALGEKTTRNDTASTPVQTIAANESSFDYQTFTGIEKDQIVAKLDEIDLGWPEVPFIRPVLGFKSRGYEPDEGHYGIDFSGKEGSPIFAAAAGTIIFSDWSYDYGFMIVISHGKGFVTVYKHNQSLLKSEGEPVQRGELIALLGNTGKRSTGPHLHFEVWRNGFTLDPEEYLIN